MAMRAEQCRRFGADRTVAQRGTLAEQAAMLI
jgi:hypothetical protein